MLKIDFKKEFPQLYKASAKKIAMVKVPEMNFLMVDGRGDPNKEKSFTDAVEGLYSVSYTLKFMVKKGERQIDYVVPPLEGLWWADDMRFFAANKDLWKWTMMIMQPEYVDDNLVKEALSQVGKKKNLTSLTKIRFETFSENSAAQILHIGPYSEEGPAIEKLHEFIKESGFERAGKHHEIYLSDPRRAAPEKLKTIIRQPVKQVQD